MDISLYKFQCSKTFRQWLNIQISTFYLWSIHFLTDVLQETLIFRWYSQGKGVWVTIFVFAAIWRITWKRLWGLLYGKAGLGWTWWTINLFRSFKMCNKQSQNSIHSFDDPDSMMLVILFNRLLSTGFCAQEETGTFLHKMTRSTTNQHKTRSYTNWSSSMIQRWLSTSGSDS